MTTTVAVVGLTTMSATGYECITARGNDFEAFASDSIDPFANFSPVCPASDGVFRVGQRLALPWLGIVISKIIDR